MPRRERFKIRLKKTWQFKKTASEGLLLIHQGIEKEMAAFGLLLHSQILDWDRRGRNPENSSKFFLKENFSLENFQRLFVLDRMSLTHPITKLLSSGLEYDRNFFWPLSIPSFAIHYVWLPADNFMVRCFGSRIMRMVYRSLGEVKGLNTQETRLTGAKVKE